MQLIDLSRCRNVQMLSNWNVEISRCGVVEFWMSRYRDVEMWRCRRCWDADMLRCRDAKISTCRDVEKEWECWLRTLTDLLQAHENGVMTKIVKMGEKVLTVLLLSSRHILRAQAVLERYLPALEQQAHTDRDQLIERYFSLGFTQRD